MAGHYTSTYKINAAEAAEIKAAGGQARHVVLDFEFKNGIYGESNK